MGLDMHLSGRKFLWTDWKHPEKNLTEDGFRVEEKVLELGYWRKHPDLHGFIVKNFASGKDECQKIHLTVEGMEQIIRAIEANELPHTEGFFFGASRNDPAEKAEAVRIFRKAIEWAKVDEHGFSRSVIYRASW